jgi:gamma-glutamyltranspeptidase/glutathione hydrolase
MIKSEGVTVRNMFLLPLILSSTLLYGHDRFTGKSFATRSEVIARNGMAATSQPLATQVALDILKNGGNAIDAAIAANAVLGVVEPMSNGIGGDLFAIVWDAKTKKLHGLNASGPSPKSLSLKILKDKGLDKIPTHGVLSISVPGCVDGWYELHKKFGKLPMKDILAPAIAYAKEGYPVTEIIAYLWQDIVPYIKDQPGFKETFMPGGKAPKKGDVFKNPKLASSLSKIASEGRDAFYKGAIAKAIDAFVKKHKGYLTKDDLASYSSEWIEPVSTNYRGYDIWELPPNGQGIAALQILNILEGYDIKKMGFGSTEYLHLLIEAKKLAYEDRAKYYSDPGFNKIPVNKLISKKYAEQRRKLINPKHAAKTYDPGNLETGNTIYLTVADKDGNMVSLIQSTYWEFGSGMVPPGLGFALQNRGELFSLDEKHFNAFKPGKRPFHTIIPAFITKKGKPYISFGVMGGSMQPQGHAQIIVNLIDFGMNLQEAGDAPRIRHSGNSQPTGSKMTNGGQVNVESGFSQETIQDLIKMGHKARNVIVGYGGYQAIMWDEKNKVYFGASESRKDGQAAGY